MEDYPGNSHSQRSKDEQIRPKIEEKKIERVTVSVPKRQKRSLGKRFKETFIGGDSRSVWSYVVFDVMVPAAKDMISDAASTAVERTLFGEGRGGNRRNRGRSGSNGYVAYNRYSESRNSPSPFRDERREPRRDITRRARSSHDFDEIILETRVEAEEVIDRLFDLVSRYESASVSDLYELTGISGSYTDEKWGWTDIRGAGVTRVRNGYLLDLPRPEPLDS